MHSSAFQRQAHKMLSLTLLLVGTTHSIETWHLFKIWAYFSSETLTIQSNYSDLRIRDLLKHVLVVMCGPRAESIYIRQSPHAA